MRVRTRWISLELATSLWWTQASRKSASGLEPCTGALGVLVFGESAANASRVLGCRFFLVRVAGFLSVWTLDNPLLGNQEGRQLGPNLEADQWHQIPSLFAGYSLDKGLVAHQ